MLGIKGTLSVVELKVLRQRMQAGQESKARRGELFKRLPVGYTKNAVGKVVLHSDRRVAEAIQLVFTKFRELWSVRQTFQWFRDHDVELPANPIRGTRLIWKIPVKEAHMTNLRQPRYFSQFDGMFSWSPDGKFLVFISGRDGFDGVYVVTVDGRQTIQLTNESSPNPGGRSHSSDECVSDCGLLVEFVPFALDIVPIVNCSRTFLTVFCRICGGNQLSLQWRQQCLAPRRKVLVDGVQHEAYSEVIAHDLHDLDRTLTSEMVHHLLPEFTADFVFPI